MMKEIYVFEPPKELAVLIERASLGLSEDLELAIANPIAASRLHTAVIDEFGDDHHHPSADRLMDWWFDPQAGKQVSIKIEGMESFNGNLKALAQALDALFEHTFTITIHLYKARAGSPSFAPHTDPMDVIIIAMQGTKAYGFMNREADGRLGRPSYTTLERGQAIYIPAGHHHFAVNDEDSLVLSIGLEPKEP